MSEHDAPVVPRVRAARILGGPWDAIVIGAGIGGLTAAALLAKLGGLRVVVLERHYQPGGLAQAFKRRGHVFDVGVHYVGDCGAERAPMRRLFDVLTDRRLAWSRLPDPYDRFRLADGEVGASTGLPALRAAFAGYAPREEDAIDRYLAELRACAREAPGFLLTRAAGLDVSRAPFYRWADVTTSDFLDRLGLSPRLAALVTAHFGNYGVVPSRSSFAAHASATAHYLAGAYYPVGGGGRIARELARALVARGGAVVVRAEVERVLLENERVAGVRLEDGREVRAPIVVSDVGAALTYGRLLGPDDPHAGALAEAARRIGPSASHAALYVGLDRPARALGLTGQNLWITPEATHDVSAWLEGRTREPPGLFVSCPSANDPSAAGRPGSVVASILLPYAAFARWEASRAHRRSADYEALKERLTRETLALLLRHVPELAGAVVHAEMSTPLSTRHYAAHPHGETCGLDHTPARFRSAPVAASPITGLYLTGQDAWLCGVGGAAFGALASASAILKRNLLAELVLGHR